MWRILFACFVLLIASCAPAMPVSPTPPASATAIAQPTPSASAPPEQAHLTHGPIVGAVTNTDARVFARTNDSAQVELVVGENETLTDGIKLPAQTTRAENDFTTFFSLTKLKPATIYYLDIVVNGISQLTPPLPRFKTFPNPDENVSFKFVVLSDLHAPIADVGTFKTAANENPDFVILGGDFGPGNVDTLFEKRAAYKKLYNPTDTSTWTPSFVSQILYRFPVAHIWDDHDFGKNNANKSYPFKAASYQALTEYFPVYPLSQYGDWQKFSYAQADFFMLDSRSQRDPNGTPDGPETSMLDGNKLGAQGQLEWLKQGLLNSKAKWKFIVSPVVFNKTFEKLDSWYGFQYERSELLKFIQDNSITGVIVLSGDAHMGALDDGTHSDLPEMLVPGPNLPACSSEATPGQWSAGMYWTEKHGGAPCNGYGVVSVQANPARVKLEIKDAAGNLKLALDVVR